MMQLDTVDHLKGHFFAAQEAYSKLLYIIAFDQDHAAGPIQDFYLAFATLYNCTRHPLMKSLAEDNNKTVSEIEAWLTSSTIDKINIKQGARLFNDYCWLVINNRIVIITQESRK